MCAASTASPSETSSIAVATRASAVPRPAGAADARASARERGPGGAERPADDDEVARARAGASGNARRPPERSHGEEDELCPRRVAAAHGNARLGETLVQLEHIRDTGGARQAERDDERERLCAGCGQVAEIHRGGAETELAPREQVQTEVHPLDERVLGDDETAHLRRVVLDPLREAATLELRQQAELAEPVDGHSSPMRVRPSTAVPSMATLTVSSG